MAPPAGASPLPQADPEQTQPNGLDRRPVDAARPDTSRREAPQRSRNRLYGAAPESNRPSVGLPHRTGFEDLLGHRAHAAPPRRVALRERAERVLDQEP